ncbi:hypothetical protein DFH11DRAFT_182971 [Phellopilus nigrolimitatus]|nr:hypothetical protein DFH11DRAFT_182971 [Phellopilus nigrolimitatus]
MVMEMLRSAALSPHADVDPQHGLETASQLHLFHTGPTGDTPCLRGAHTGHHIATGAVATGEGESLKNQVRESAQLLLPPPQVLPSKFTAPATPAIADAQPDADHAGHHRAEWHFAGLETGGNGISSATERVHTDSGVGAGYFSVSPPPFYLFFLSFFASTAIARRRRVERLFCLFAIAERTAAVRCQNKKIEVFLGCCSRARARRVDLVLLADRCRCPRSPRRAPVRQTRPSSRRRRCPRSRPNLRTVRTRAREL